MTDNASPGPQPPGELPTPLTGLNPIILSAAEGLNPLRLRRIWRAGSCWDVAKLQPCQLTWFNLVNPQGEAAR